MLVRPAGEKGLEVFMLRRSEASHFVPDVYVFPGGTLDASDCSERALARARGIDDANLQQQFRAKPAPALPAPFDSPPLREAAGLLIAAVRELYEEAGVLLACDDHGNALSTADLASHAQQLQDARAAVQSGEVPFHEVLERAGVYANAAALSLFSRWITPPPFPRRYDAHFFLAQAAPDHVGAADAFETHDEVWISPKEALERCERGTFRMVYPTIKHVERLAQFDNVGALFEFSRTKTIYSIMPDTPAERQFSMPPELEYAW